MILITDNYTFKVHRQKTRNGYIYTIGDKAPCLEVMVGKFDGKWWMCVEDLHFEPSCSSDKPLAKKTGTIEMLQGALKAILEKHPEIELIELNDKSKFMTAENRLMPLPEYRMIMKGCTWYQEHFGAISPPHSGLDRKLHQYLNTRTTIKRKLQNAEVNEKTFRTMLRNAGLPQLSAERWIIPISAIQAYPTSGHFKRVYTTKDASFIMGGQHHKYAKEFELHFQIVPYEAI